MGENRPKKQRPGPDDVVLGPEACCAWSQTLDFQTYESAHFFSLKIVVFLLLLLKTDASSSSGDVQVTGHTEWRERAGQ